MSESESQNDSDTGACESEVPRGMRGFWRRPWWVRWLTYGGIGLVLLIGTYGFFDIRGRLRWKAHVTRIEAAGGSLELHNAVKKPATDGDFWLDPFVQRLLNEEEQPLSFGESYLSDVDTDFDQYVPSQKKGWGWRAAQFDSLEAPYSKLGLTRKQAAERILQKLDPLAADFAQLAAAAVKPASAFPWPESFKDWEDISKFGGKGSLQGVARMLELRSLSFLETGQSAAAADDLQTSLHLARHLQHDAFLEDLMIEGAVIGIAQQVLWEGLSRRVWSDPELSQIQTALSEILDSKAQLPDVLAMEAAWAASHFETAFAPVGKRWKININSWQVFPIFRPSGAFFDNTGMGEVVELLNPVCFATIPTSVLRENLIVRHDLNEKTLLNPSLTLRDRLKAEKDAVSKIESSQVCPPTQVFIQFTIAIIWEIYERNVGKVETARAAVAAERYFLTHGRYPASWADLVPKWLHTIPRDFDSGGDQLYSIGPDGRPVIYAVGENGADDGSLPKRKQSKGDAVWRYSLPPGFTLDDYAN